MQNGDVIPLRGNLVCPMVVVKRFNFNLMGAPKLSLLKSDELGGFHLKAKSSLFFDVYHDKKNICSIIAPGETVAAAFFKTFEEKAKGEADCGGCKHDCLIVSVLSSVREEYNKKMALAS
ncbi:MAG: hypothetical protein Q8Q21_00975 [bacterium]|nr:hypothetical protein [bacterium]